MDRDSESIVTITVVLGELTDRTQTFDTHRLTEIAGRRFSRLSAFSPSFPGYFALLPAMARHSVSHRDIRGASEIPWVALGPQAIGFETLRLSPSICFAVNSIVPLGTRTRSELRVSSDTLAAFGVWEW